jgi:hypothetical protein
MFQMFYLNQNFFIIKVLNKDIFLEHLEQYYQLSNTWLLTFNPLV